MNFKRLILAAGFAALSTVFVGSLAAQEKPATEQKPAWNFAEGDFAPLFPFKIEKGAPDNITNIQTWGAPWQNPSVDGILKIRDGQFYAGDRPFAFMGTNTCFTANFTTKEKAALLAKTFARFGVRVIRLHHMDSSAIWGKNFAKTKTEIDPEQLDKLDYYISELEKNGVYVNINLHVSRFLDERDGFKNSDTLPNHTKGVDNFEPRMIELQKKYAKDLLTHVNPYTGRAYSDDPGVAMIEINNENSIIASWYGGRIDKIGEPYAAQLQARWNDWLAKKYESTAALKKAWGDRNEPISDDQILPKAFSPKLVKGGAQHWEVQRDNLSRQTVSILSADEAKLPNPKSADSNVLKVSVEKMGKAPWVPQVFRVGLKLEKDAIYTWSFKVRANREVKLSGGVRQNHEPWQGVGCDKSFEVSPEWKSYSYTFISSATDENVRVAFSSFTPGLEVELADVSLEKGGRVGLADGETLEAKTIPFLRRYSSELFSGDAVVRDFMSFLVDLETGYWNEMFRYVKDDLHAKPPVSGTQLQYGSWYAQGALDYCDNHSYWHHPNFLHRPWDGNDWQVGSSALANAKNGGTIASLSANRVVGRAQTISEYDHPYPNLCGAEGNLMIAALGAFQGWTGVNQFAWSHGEEFDSKGQTTFFDMSGNQAKMAHLPACYVMLERGDVTRGPGKFAAVGDLTKEGELDFFVKKYRSWANVGDITGVDPSLTMAVYGGTNLTEIPGLAASVLPKDVTRVKSWSELPKRFGSPEKKWVTNEFGELSWNFEIDEAGYFTVKTPGVKLFTGFVRDRGFDLGGVLLKPGKTRLDWTTVSITRASGESPKTVQKDGKEILGPGRYLIAATGLVQNTDAKFVEMAKDQISTASAYGGNPGHAPVLCEGISAELTLPQVAAEKVAFYPLSAAGDRGDAAPVQSADSGAVVRLDPKYKTVWYELVIQE